MMNMQNMMLQAQKMQKELDKKLAEFKLKTFEYNYKNDSIVVTIMGNCTIVGIKINKILIDPDDSITLEEMICEAINAAIKGVLDDQAQIQNSVTSKSRI